MSDPHPDTVLTPPEELGAETGSAGALPDFEAFDAIGAATTDTLNRLSEGETCS